MLIPQIFTIYLLSLTCTSVNSEQQPCDPSTQQSKGRHEFIQHQFQMNFSACLKFSDLPKGLA